MKEMLRRLALPLLAVALLIGLITADIPVLSLLATILLGGLVALLVVWLTFKAYQAVLWKVGRRLAFSYFLIGILPIPMVAALALAVAYLLSSVFLSHVYRNSLELFQADLVAQAEERLSLHALGRSDLPASADYAFDYYRDGSRVEGAGWAAESWPDWLTKTPRAGEPEGVARYVLNDEGYPTLAVAVTDGSLGVTAVYRGSLAATLRKQAAIWVEHKRQASQEAQESPEESEETDMVTTVGEVKFRSSKPQDTETPDERQDFFAARAKSDGFLDAPRVHSWQVSGPIFRLEDGSEHAVQFATTLTTTPRDVLASLFSNRPEQDIVAWAALMALATVLSTLYGIAVLLAVAMIVGLSRAVNGLSSATNAVRKGDFSVRIPVYRRDQLGELQRSFNQMTAEMEGLVATAAQKEVLEKELEIAGQLQESLLPIDLPQGDAIEFATLFEPSAAIGGDYFDILRLDENHLAIVIADVSGHGLSSGLRMAMMKAALQILIDSDTRPDPGQIFARLDKLVRANAHTRFFVTATLAILDTETGLMELTNAGHPPTYIVRDGEVLEILLPGDPLGILSRSYGTREVQLEDGDLAVWMSDGLIEATNPEDDAFGYDRVVEALSGPARAPIEIRARLLAAVEHHAEGREPDDDRTLVVMRYGQRV